MSEKISGPRESLLEKMIQIPQASMDFNTAEAIANQKKRMEENSRRNGNAIGEALQNSFGILANSPRFTEYLPQIFAGESFESSISEKLTDVLCSMKDDNARRLLAGYTGAVIGGKLDGSSINLILDLNKPVLQYSSEELNDLTLRIDTLSRLPQPSKHHGFAWWDGNAVDTALKLSGASLQEYNLMLRDLQGLERQPSGFYNVLMVLKPDEISHNHLQDYFHNLRRLIKTSHFSERTFGPLTKAMETGKPERMDYVVHIVQEAAQLPEIKKWSHMLSDYTNLLSKFITFKNDDDVKEFYEATLKLVDLEVTEFIDELSHLLENQSSGSFMNQEKENLSEDDLVARTKEALPGFISLFENNLPREVLVAYNAKGGKNNGLNTFFKIASIPEIVKAFKAISTPQVHSYAREVMANALTHGDEDFAKEYAKTITKLAKVNGLPSLYKRMDTEDRSGGSFEKNSERWKKAVKVLGSDQVVDVLSHYNSKKMRPVVSVMVNALWNNPDMVDAWSKTMMDLKDEIYSVQGEHRGKIKDYFGVRSGFRTFSRQQFPSKEMGYFDMRKTLNNWLNDYKPIEATK